jgi:50S ribosomal protein L16 3-hydroxylase
MGKHPAVSSGFSPSDFSLARLLGGITPEQFLADYWQKKPLLVRQALPGFGGWLDRRGLSELACRDDAESRLVHVHRGQWRLEHGPFEPETLDALPKRGWSLLVSGVNHLLPDADRLLHGFDFLPQARLDDLMVSFAPPGGGVGPHFDSYDVFLIQGLGRRRWEIGCAPGSESPSTPPPGGAKSILGRPGDRLDRGQDDLDLVEGAPLRILRNFRVDQAWELETGDMLYLPPRFAHNGVALTDCMTWSVGFRAPKAQEIVGQFLAYLQDTLERDGIYADPALKRPRHAAEVPTDMLEWAARTIDTIRWDRHDIVDFLGRYLSEPKAHVFFDPPRRPLSPAAFQKAVGKRGVALDPRSQLLFRAQVFFMNGERTEVSRTMLPTLRMLADQRRLAAGALDAALLSLLHVWYRAGYLFPGK